MNPDPRAIVFDIMGTVVDLDGGVRRATAEVLGRRGATEEVALTVADATKARLPELLADVNADRRPWAGNKALRRVAIRDAVAGAGLEPLTESDEAELASVVHRLDPWPDSAEGLARLRAHRLCVGLTNADPRELADFSLRGGLAWHLALSTRSSRAFKPDPRAYAVALDTLELPPSDVLKVASHVWDLRGASGVGMRTCLVRRPGEEQGEDGEFDLVVDDLLDLADRLGLDGTHSSR